MRGWHEAARGHLKPASYLCEERKLDSVGPVVFAAGLCGDAVGDLLLHHHDGALEVGHLLKEVQDDGRCHVVG